MIIVRLLVNSIARSGGSRYKMQGADFVPFGTGGQWQDVSMSRRDTRRASARSRRGVVDFSGAKTGHVSARTAASERGRERLFAPANTFFRTAGAIHFSGASDSAAEFSVGARQDDGFAC